MEIVPQLFVNALIAGSIYALVSFGLSLTYNLLKVLNFAHGHMMMFGVYLFYLLHVMEGWNVVIAAIGTVFLSIVFAAIIFRAFMQPFLQYSFLLALISTLALSTMLESIVAMVFGVQVKSLPLELGVTSFEVYGVFITPIQILIISSALILLPVLSFVIHRTSLGRKLRAMAENRYVAESYGISRRKLSYGVIIVSTLIASYAGVLIGYETNMQPTMGTSYTVKAFAAMILGGLGNIWGTVVGSYVLGLLENFGIGLEFGGYSIPAGYKDAFAFFIMLVVLLFRPQGIFGKKAREA